MKVGDLVDVLGAELIVGEDLLENEIESACGSDLMSDVLAFVKEKTVLLTGLTNPHVIRTAEMLDLLVIVFVRGKIPGDEIVEMARERKIAILNTDLSLYSACGRLYQMGLRGCMR